MEIKSILVLLLAVSLSLSSGAQPKAGTRATEIVLPNINGKMQKLSGNTGKVVLLDFWASWCGPCRKANPELVRLYAKYKQKGFQIFSVSIDDDQAAWKKAVVKDKMTWTQVNESKGWDGPVATAWKIEQIPASYLMDKSGKIVGVDLQGKELEDTVAKLVK